jgi:hypothetical protein
MNREQIIKEIQAKSQQAFSEIRTQALQEAVRNMSAVAATGDSSSGGGGRTPSLEFVVNTFDSTYFTFNFTSTGEPIEFTIEWGDGTVHVDSGGGGYYSENHTYDEIGDYTVKVYFDDPLKILELDFPGDSDAPIKSISRLQNLANLQQFRADYNALETVDLSGLTQLTYVDISDCDLVDSNTPSLTSVNLSGCYNLDELRLDDSDFSGGIPDLVGLVNLRFFDFDQCGITGSVDLSFLPALEGFDIYGNEGLTNVIIDSSQPLGDNGTDIYIDECALTEEAVDDILVALSTNGITGGYIDLTGGTNSIPGAAGLAAKTVLEGNGWSVNVNS